MYIRSIQLQNIRSFTNFEMEFEHDEFSGWHVLIGDNGSGKSTVVRSIALALVGPSHTGALRQNWSNWLRSNTDGGRIRVDIDFDPILDKLTGKGKAASKYYIPLILTLRQLEKTTRSGQQVEILDGTKNTSTNAFRYAWGEGEGWFSASYGPFRRFSGGNKDFEKLYYADPKLAPHLSAFGEDVALSECLDWLQQLHVKKLENKPEGMALDHITRFINEGQILPHGTILEEVSSDAVIFKDGNGCPVPVDQLSDGYRSVLSMTFELIRQMIFSYGERRVFEGIKRGSMKINLPGIVIIDEVDAHLHPNWQRRIGPWFTSFFPKIQFIVTTHSPLVCQAAELGTVWRLPTPGVDVVEEGPFGRITGVDLQRLMYGSIIEAYDTGLFGKDVSRSEASKEKMMRLAQLNQKKLHKGLTKKEQNELRVLRETLPTVQDTIGPE